MGKNDFRSGLDTVGEATEELLPGEVLIDREVELVFISDGKYKYVYADTKEDVV
jgi:hypothetical protein